MECRHTRLGAHAPTIHSELDRQKRRVLYQSEETPQIALRDFKYDPIEVFKKCAFLLQLARSDASHQKELPWRWSSFSCGSSQGSDSRKQEDGITHKRWRSALTIDSAQTWPLGGAPNTLQEKGVKALSLVEENLHFQKGRSIWKFLYLLFFNKNGCSASETFGSEK